MNKQLQVDVNDIRKLIFSFSLLELKKEFDLKQSLANFSASNKTLVFGASKGVADKFIEHQINRNGLSIEELNNRYFFCVNATTFKSNELFFENIIFADNRLPLSYYSQDRFEKDCFEILELNRLVAEFKNDDYIIHSKSEKY